MKRMLVTIPDEFRGFVSVSLVYSVGGEEHSVGGEEFSVDAGHSVCHGFDISRNERASIHLTDGGSIYWAPADDDEEDVVSEMRENIREMGQIIDSIREKLAPK